MQVNGVEVATRAVFHACASYDCFRKVHAWAKGNRWMAYECSSREYLFLREILLSRVDGDPAVVYLLLRLLFSSVLSFNVDDFVDIYCSHPWLARGSIESRVFLMHMYSLLVPQTNVPIQVSDQDICENPFAKLAEALRTFWRGEIPYAELVLADLEYIQDTATDSSSPEIIFSYRTCYDSVTTPAN